MVILVFMQMQLDCTGSIRVMILLCICNSFAIVALRCCAGWAVAVFCGEMLAPLQTQRLLHPPRPTVPSCHSRRVNIAAGGTKSVTWLAGGFCLQGVEATLLGTLQARAAEQSKQLPIIHDELAGHILARLGCAPRAEPAKGAYCRTVLRSVTIDHWVDAFLAEHPNGTVVELGVGLNTRFERIARDRGYWIEVDLPRVIQLRDHVTLPNARRRHLAASVAALDWVDDVFASSGPHCFVAEALFGYLPPMVVRWLLQTIGERFPGATVIFDTHPKWGVVEDARLEQLHDGVHRQAEVVAALVAWCSVLQLEQGLPLLPFSAIPLRSSTAEGRRQAQSSILTRWTANCS